MSGVTYFDVTTVMQAPKKPVGIARIEFEMCRHLLTHDADCRFCQYDARAGVFVAVPRAAVMAEVARFGRAEAPSGAAQGGTATGVRLADGLRGLLRLLASPAVIARLRRLRTMMRRGAALHERGAAFAPGDRFLWFGLSWDPARLAALRQLRERVGIACICYCHDIIPHLFPQHVGEASRQQFALYMETIAACATGMLFNSACSRRDFLACLDGSGRPRPPSAVVNPAVNDFPAPADDAVSPDVRALAGEPYVLYVSTIEGRKNHDLLYKACLHLLARGLALPRLVFLGGDGWCATELLYSLRHDPRIRDRITVVGNASDDELAFLYRHCLFTVYPSFYEGWGMPVSESLSLGRFCITSGQGALGEAGAGLTDEIDPYDVVAWAEAMRHYATHPEALAEREARIRACYVAQDWAAFGRQSLDFITGCGHAS